MGEGQRCRWVWQGGWGHGWLENGIASQVGAGVDGLENNSRIAGV